MSLSKISGFPEYLPEIQIAFNKAIDLIRNKFEAFGFAPLETPAVEKVSTLLAKGNDNEIYGIYRLADAADKKDLGLRFDLTVPLARYVAQHMNELVFPYKRYHIAPVWRGERAQAGRYRQFYQCDIDIIDNTDLSLNCDAEIITVLTEILKDFKLDFEFKLNNKKVLEGFLQNIIGDNLPSIEILRVIDKRDKVDTDKFCALLEEIGLSSQQIIDINNFLEISKDKDSVAILDFLKKIKSNPQLEAGILELSDLLQNLEKMNIDMSRIKVDTSLARGLTYYTGSIFEAKLKDTNFTSSICGGGRYDNLTTYFSKNRFPGVGATIGISRILPVLIENNLIDISQKTPAQILVATQDKEFLCDYFDISQQLRGLGFKVEVFLQEKKLSQQLAYASKKGIRFVIIANKDELSNGVLNLRDLSTGEQIKLHKEELATKIYEVCK